jgi:MFS family permease
MSGGIARPLICRYLVVVMLGYGIIMPIIPFYIEKLGASGRDLGMLTAISALMQLIFAPLWGSLSDRVGAPVLLIGVLGYGVTMLPSAWPANCGCYFWQEC